MRKVVFESTVSPFVTVKRFFHTSIVFKPSALQMLLMAKKLMNNPILNPLIAISIPQKKVKHLYATKNQRRFFKILSVELRRMLAFPHLTGKWGPLLINLAMQTSQPDPNLISLWLPIPEIHTISSPLTPLIFMLF
jgi:hypothetical protein